jgi:hypothetical protein
MVFAKAKGVDYLLMAKPVAFNQLGIRHDCAVSFMIRSVVGSSLRRPPFLLPRVTESSVSRICEIGEQGGSVVDIRLLVCFAERTLTL